MNTQAIEELMAEGFDEVTATLMAIAEEEDGVVFDLESGEELAVDPDGPIEYEITVAGEAATI